MSGVVIPPARKGQREHQGARYFARVVPDDIRAALANGALCREGAVRAGGSTADVVREYLLGILAGIKTDPGYDGGLGEQYLGIAAAAVLAAPDQVFDPEVQRPWWALDDHGTPCPDCAHQGARCGGHH